MKKIYHSALWSEMCLDNELDRYESDGNVVFRHDVLQLVHPDFYHADVVYIEPAWKDGYEVYAERAGCKEQSYDNYLIAIRRIIAALGIPAYSVIGKAMLKRLSPDFTAPVKIHGYPCLLASWNAEPFVVKTNYDAADEVAKRYDRILDFCCGYGNTARSALRFGKSFVCSDFNGKCVYYVAKEMMGYEPYNSDKTS